MKTFKELNEELNEGVADEECKSQQLDEGIWDGLKMFGRDVIQMYKEFPSTLKWLFVDSIKEMYREMKKRYKDEEQAKTAVKRVMELVQGDPAFKELIRNNFVDDEGTYSGRRVKKGQSKTIKSYMADRLPPEERNLVNTYYNIISKIERGQLKESISEVNNTGIGYIIPYTLNFITQAHVWHLLCTSGQKHMALGELYEELQDQVDELAEKFIAQGGKLEPFTGNIVAVYNENDVLNKIDEFRNIVTSAIDTNPRMASIVDDIIDLQEIIDAKLYKFKLN